MTSSRLSARKLKMVEEALAAGGAGSDDDDHECGMDKATRQALSGIDECQKELDELDEKESKEITHVEAKYNKLRKPYYDKRAAVIDKIPNFWVIAIVNHPQISMLVDEEEEDCLYFLKKLEVEEFENVENGFRVKFVFDENPFFDNQELVKEINLGLNTEPQSTSTGIKWKEQMDLSKKQPPIIDARRKRGLEQKTFFSWFSDNKAPAADDIAEVIKDDLWPNPLQHYLTPDMEDGDEESLDESEEDEDMMDGETRQALSDLEECQKELDKLNQKASKEVLQVETKYNKLRKPSYDKRAAVIDKIPNFWVKAIVNHPRISMLVGPDGDEKGCLYFLTKLEVEEFENFEEDRCRIKFVFDDNPYFENQELVKEFYVRRGDKQKCTSTEIKWKEQMDISKKQPQIIDVKRKRGRKKLTFFSWFSNKKALTAQHVLEAIRCDLWSNPLQYYLNLRRRGSLRRK